MNIVVSDSDYLETTTREQNHWLKYATQDKPIVLVGNSESNSAWANFVASDSPSNARPGRVDVDQQHREGSEFAGWFMPAGRSAKVVALFETGSIGARALLNLAIPPALSTKASPRFQIESNASLPARKIDTPEPR